MDYNQFRQLMEPEGIGSKESIGTLQEFVNEFPYFQTAQALLAKAFHEQQHVRYDRQLKIAAAYSSDRKSLYALIHQRNSPVFAEKKNESPFISPGEETRVVVTNDFVETETTTPLTPPEEKQEAWVNVITPEPVFELPETEIEETPIVSETSSSDDPHEIIRKRLEEILGKKEENPSEEKKAETKVEIAPEAKAVIAPQPEIKPIAPVEITPSTTPEIDASPVIIPEPKAQAPAQKEEGLLEKISQSEEIANDPIGRIGLEYALEATILQSIEKLPAIEKSEVVVEESVTESREEPTNFFAWLKSKHTAEFGKVEEVHAEEKLGQVQKTTPTVTASRGTTEQKAADESSSGQESGKLIDRFIATAPRIVPSKVEFYSPANQAKKSIIEHEDLVSETLAKIYALQGHLMKARSCYVKLSLLNPEKKAYFAALIQEIDNHYNNPDNQDL